jgi:hypothetical protein
VACRAAQRAREAAQATLKSSTHPVLSDGVAGTRGVAKTAGAADIAAAAAAREASTALLDASRAHATVASTLAFTPITVVWRHVSYYVPVPKNLQGEAARGIMPADAGGELAGKKRLLNDITGAPLSHAQLHIVALESCSW